MSLLSYNDNERRKSNASGCGRRNVDTSVKSQLYKWRKFVERHLFVENRRFLITPNGGTGDCMFKAVCQAIEGSELNHVKIREEVVHFVVNHRWDKLKESIEIQHVQGNQPLQKHWERNAKDAYINYMNASGTLGSASELNAAGELFHYNFVTIQEYADAEKSSYRIENCCPFNDPTAPFHYFYFTGDFDNGHWEYLEPINELIKETICDGLYGGKCGVFIEEVETSLEEWLKIHTENTNDIFRLKHSSARFPSKKSRDPFEWGEAFQYEENGCVLLNGMLFSVSKLRGTDLFSILSAILYPEVKNLDASVIDNFEDKIINYRLDNIDSLNYKLITQPYSHGFDIDKLKYLAMTCKGNIQDLLSSADIFGFSFQIFIKTALDQEVKSCRFVHVDRWGGETDRMLHFFMRLCTGPKPEEEVIGKWWQLVPQFESLINLKSDSNKNYIPDSNQIGDFSAGHESKATEQYSQRDSTFVDEISVSESGDDDHVHKNISSAHHASSKEASEEYSEEEMEPKKAKKLRHLKKEIVIAKKTSNSSSDAPPRNTKHQTCKFSKSEYNKKSQKRRNPKPKRAHKKLTSSPDRVFVPTKTTSSSNKDDSKVHGKFRTIVEIYDDVTNKRKEYVFHGRKTKDEVLQILYERGYIKNIKVHNQDTTAENQSETLSIHCHDGVDVVSPILTPIIAKSNHHQATEDFNSNRSQNEISIAKSSSDISLLTNKHNSVSVIALANQESVEEHGKFLALHQRLSPWRSGRREKKQNLMQRFITFMSTWFKICKKKKIEPIKENVMSV